jgi:hypothetical protein
MKKSKKVLLLSSIFLFYWSIGIGQQANSGLFVWNGETKQQTISDLLSTSKKATEKLYFIFYLDVYGYFELTDTYDTDLKKLTFEKTTAYQDYVNQLKGLKESMFKNSYFIMEKQYGYNNDRFPDYDINRKGFQIDISYLIPLYIDSTSDMVDYGYTISCSAIPDAFFIPIDETNGLEIENNRDKDTLGIYYFFTISPVLEIIKNKYGAITDSNIKSNSVRIVFANVSTGKIYFDKTYTEQATKKIKHH